MVKSMFPRALQFETSVKSCHIYLYTNILFKSQQFYSNKHEKNNKKKKKTELQLHFSSIKGFSSVFMFVLEDVQPRVTRWTGEDFHVIEGRASEHTYLLCNQHGPIVVRRCLTARKLFRTPEMNTKRTWFWFEMTKHQFILWFRLNNIGAFTNSLVVNAILTHAHVQSCENRLQKHTATITMWEESALIEMQVPCTGLPSVPGSVDLVQHSASFGGHQRQSVVCGR